MKKSKLILALLLGGAVFFNSCIDTHKDIKYNNYTKADTEAFNFLNKVYEQAIFQQYAAKNYNLGAQSQSISQTYKALAEEIVNLAAENNVLIQELPTNYFDQRSNVTSEKSPAFAKNDTLAVDSNLRNPIIAHSNEDELPNAATKELYEGEAGHETTSQKVLHSQEETVHACEVAGRNTNVSVRRFAQQKLTELEELLEESKSSIK